MGLQSHSKPSCPLESIGPCPRVALSSKTVQIRGRYCLLQQEERCPAVMPACASSFPATAGTLWWHQLSAGLVLGAPPVPSPCWVSVQLPKNPSSQALAVTKYLLRKLLCRPLGEPCLSGQQPAQVISSPSRSDGNTTAALHRFLLNSRLFSTPPVVATFWWWVNWFLCIFWMPGYYNYSSGSFGMKGYHRDESSLTINIKGQNSP